jgi:hypothetical protein
MRRIVLPDIDFQKGFTMTIYEKIRITPTGWVRRTWRLVRALRFALAALGAGSRTLALADNSQVVLDLSARAQYLYGPE